MRRSIFVKRKKVDVFWVTFVNIQWQKEPLARLGTITLT